MDLCQQYDNFATCTNDNPAVSARSTGRDADSRQLTTFAVVNGPAHGTLTSFNASTGAFSYAPTAGYIGFDSFTFTMSDGTNNSTVATVAITVDATADLTPTCGLLGSRTRFITSAGSIIAICLAEETVKVEPAVLPYFLAAGPSGAVEITVQTASSPSLTSTADQIEPRQTAAV